MSEIQDVMNNMLSVFAAPVRDMSIDNYSFVEILEKSSRNPLSSSMPYYEFLLDDRNSWLNLSEAYVEIRAKIQTTAGQTIFAGNAAPISGAQNFFRRAEMWIENNSVQSVEYPGVVGHVMDLVKSSPDYEKSGSGELFYPDRGAEPINVIDGALTDTVNGAPSTVTAFGANPHVLEPNGAPGDAVVLFADGQVIFARKSTDASILALTQVGVGTGSITYAGAADGDIIYLYDQFSRRVYLKTPTGTKYVTQLRVNVATVLTMDDGVATAVVAGQIFGYNPAGTGLVDDSGQFAARKTKFTAITGRFDTSSVFYVPLRKIFSFWDHNRHIWKGATMRIRLDRDMANECMYRDASITVLPFAAPADLDCRVVIDYMSLWLPVVNPSPSIDAQLTLKIKSNTSQSVAWYDYEYFENNQITTVAASTIEQIWKVTSKADKITRVYAWLQRTDARTSQLVNKGLFGGYDIQSAQCSIGGVIYPRTKYQFDPGYGFNYERLYNEYLRAGNHVANPSTGAMLSIEEWHDLYEIICFDLTYQPPRHTFTPLDVEIRVKLATAAQQDFRMYAVIQTEKYAKKQCESDIIKLV